ncbi:bifunctional UDP-N-acetylglucosamine diphosphorylase/glucosamine-1-phosphate N-acetyltransferase GlmU [Paenibacillus thermotolerans]|uniref:bifunctional UDP-N-acetylglucosamine diphosphorylase/glucosamine-1-phosphate N-acetyltransferase GlmU n=1 Tax=Paenibacillus thermotolerans TaxID=3027807 RepID=UPI002368EB42|nr:MULTISPECIES: bifunctional UDP-N-acetylglucosamine diphosphorylase/glucosamine-1-phosphate N-acetyltransferase GlmU [unclassified Paenibacillus]
MNVMGVVLAAGLGKRMKSKLYKVLHPVCGRPMVRHVVDTLQAAGVGRKIVVVGHGAEAVQAALGDEAEYAVQEQQLGTGHAVRMAESKLSDAEGITVVAYGDTPLIKAETVAGMIERHKESGAGATLLVAEFQNPAGLGRIVFGQGGAVERIVEDKDCTPEERKIRFINAGTYCFDNRKLFAALAKVTNKNAQGEYYLTDVIEIMKSEGDKVIGYLTDDPNEALGVNDRVALSEAEKHMRARINRAHMMNGVSLIDPDAVYIEAGVTIGPDTTIYPGTMLKGGTTIGSDCVIGPNSDITGSVIADGAVVKQSVLSEAVVGPRTSVGPFAYLRPGTKLGEDVKIGDFVEVKNAVIGAGSKVSHLAYVGDAEVGKNVNFACGAVTVNYDGFAKHKTIVEDDAFVGCNVNLIAPVRVGQGAYVVAGSTITKDVPADDMAIARERQTNKPGYASMLKARLKRAKESANGAKGE